MSAPAEEIIEEARRFAQRVLTDPKLSQEPVLTERVAGVWFFNMLEPTYRQCVLQQRPDQLHDLFTVKAIDLHITGLPYHTFSMVNREKALISYEQADLDFQKKLNGDQYKGDYSAEAQKTAVSLDMVTFDRDMQGKEFAIVDQGTINSFSFIFQEYACIAAVAYLNDESYPIDDETFDYGNQKTNNLITKFYEFLDRATKEYER